MSSLSPQDFYKNLAQKINPFYFFYGDEPYLIEDAIRRVQQKVFGPSGKGDKNLNFEVFYGSDGSIEQIIDSANNLGLFSSFKMLLIKETQAFKEKALNQLQKLFESPTESTVVVFVLEGSCPKNKFYKMLSDKAITVYFKTPYERELPQWIKYLAQSHKVQLAPKVPELLLQFIGPNLLMLNNEIQKLAISLAPQTFIDESSVLKWVALSKQESVFALANAFADKDQGKTLSQLKRLLEQGQTPIGIITILARHLRILFEIKLSPALSAQSLSERLRIPAFFVRDYLRQSSKWKLEELSLGLKNLRQAEKEIKSISLSPRIIIERALVHSV